MFRKYIQNTSGNMATIFAVSIMLLLMGIGAAVDLTYMSSKRTSYQSLADLAVLAAAGSGETTKPELLAIAEAAVDANNFTGEILTTKIHITGEGRVQVSVVGTYDTMIMGLFGQSALDVNVAAEAPLALDEPVDIALVLDITGSMSGAKLDSLKAAANGLVDQIAGYDNDSIRMSVIPFREYVNVGLSRRNESWLAVDADTSTPLAEVCYQKKDITSTTNCVDTPYTRTCNNDGVDYDCSGTSTTCDYTYGPEYEYCYIPTDSDTWHGCVGSRDTPWNERARKGVAAIPGLMDVWCGQEILALTSDMTVVRSKINSLTASQLTYLPAGLIWGWRSVNPEAPLTEASSSSRTNKTTVLIFMTDGANTMSQSGVLHVGETHADFDLDNANQLTRRLCVNIKGDGVQMYTVAYDFDGVDTISILRNCASNPDMFFLAADGEALKTAFKEIGNSLLRLRLTH